MHVTSEQLRAARALLRLDQAELARRARVSVVTIRRLEGYAPGKPASVETMDRVRAALEQAGADFIPHGVQTRRTEADIQARYQAILDISHLSAEELKDRGMLTDNDMYDENGLPW